MNVLWVTETLSPERSIVPILNPFSGADLYFCNPSSVLRNVTDFLSRKG